MQKNFLKTFILLSVLVPSTLFAEEAGGVVKVAHGLGIWFFIAIAIGASFAIGVAAFGTGLAQGNAVKSAVEGVARNPQASGKITVTLMIGLAMIESLCIYALVICLILIYANPLIKYVVGG